MQEISDSSASQTGEPLKVPSANKLKPRHYWYLLRFSVFLLVVPFMRYHGCLATDSDRDEVLQLEDFLHQEMASGDIDKIYRDSDTYFQKAVSLSHHELYFAEIARKYGRPLDCSPMETEVKYGIGTKSVRSKCVTNFSGGSSAVESFTWSKTEDGYRLHYYAIHNR